MDKTGIKIIAPIIAFLFVVILFQSIVLGLFVSVATYILIRSIFGQSKSPENTSKKNKYFINSFLLLSAIMIKADGRIYKQELELVRKKLIHDFGKKRTPKYMQDLQICLKKKINLEAVCRDAKKSLDHASKIQLLHFLTGLTIVNGFLINAEYDKLKRIAILIDIPERSLQSILAMFAFKRKTSHERTNNQRERRKKTKQTSTILRAYLILEVNENAEPKAIKKAYRKLAKIHHPDRVIHLGPEFQKNAKIKFQKIADAYELIKNKRGFS